MRRRKTESVIVGGTVTAVAFRSLRDFDRTWSERWDADKEKVFPLAAEVMLTIGRAGKTVQQASDIINDSLQDWKDADELHRLNSAESEDVYLKLPVSYRARSRALQDTAELLKIRGVTREIYPGAKGQRGLVDLLRLQDDAP